jgi:hypothetical protein
MASLEEIRQILPQFRKTLLSKLNVVAAGIGYKISGGKTTDTLAIICSVDIKQAKNMLAEKDLIPSTVENIPTDVNPTGVISVFQDPRGRFRPAPGGVSLGHPRITTGTLGCYVRKNGKTYILSNNHVIANSNDAMPGDFILQPGPADGGTDPQDRLARLTEFIPIRFEEQTSTCPFGETAAGFLNLLAAASGSTTRIRTVRISTEENLVDCGLAEPLNSSDIKNEILGIGSVAGITEGTLGLNIKKSGRTTGLTTGAIEQIDVSVRVNYGSGKTALFVDQLLAGSMSQGGDSGSAVLDDSNNLVGLLFAGSQTTTIINRIQNVFQALNVTL